MTTVETTLPLNRLVPSKANVRRTGRRLAALKRLAKDGKLAKDAPIACLVLDDTDDASEISLTENAMRLDMHPDDQCEAFHTLIAEKGKSVEDVAARFGVTPAVVTRRLKLAAVSPTLCALYRKGTCTLEHMMVSRTSPSTNRLLGR